ncbi:isopeptide-forming domain-containing fimbrial protein [Bifidobacterium dentium]|uniref:isopeptide-forming domain-containing fimbrial protein n=1 Tax=Bifidobacterium dentium TaxID=1689 RepID=UPI0018C28DCB|nr:isopeptide-forming domain-containing fimbrial protein [Bifidobacterium dentium]MBF9711264.1 isopeptide-forming domain-containing fimbrial protein [Bifidobacterium dentium]
MNKVLKGLVAVAATAAMAVAGFAGASTAMAVTTGSYTITVNEKNDKHTFNAYQVFKGDLKESQNEQGGVTSRALSNIEWGSGVSEAGKTALYDWASLTFDTDKTAAKVAEKLTTNTGTVTAESFSNALAGKTSQAAHLTDTKTPLIRNAGKTAYTGTVTEAGYYLIVDEKTGEALGNNDAYSAYIMQVVGDVTVDPKSKTPTVKKEVQDETGDKDAESQDQEGWGNTADHAIGESFNFRLTATIPGDANFKAYESYKVVFNDTMSKGITFEKINSVKVKYGDTTLELADDDYTKTDPVAVPGVTDGSKAWTLTIADLKEITGFSAEALGTQEITVAVEYAAHLNNDAVVTNTDGATTTNKNGVSLDYSNNPNVGGEGDTGHTPGNDVYVYSFKIDNTKYAGKNEAGNELAGAGFTLYKYDDTKTGGKGGAVKLVWDSNKNAYRPAVSDNADEAASTQTEITSRSEDGEKGKFNIIGLDAGKYVLSETKTPEGYNTVADTTIEIKAEHKLNETVPTVTLTNSKGLANDLVDMPGSNLPSTGGMGTALLYVAGIAVFMLAGAILVMALRRRNA